MNMRYKEAAGMKQGKKTLAAAAIALAMVSVISAGSTMAYFTTFATAKGGHEITLGTETQIKETFSRWTKHVILTNTENTECYVRVRAFAGSAYELEYGGSDKWSKGDDGYWYYNEILLPGSDTDLLDIKINLPQAEDELGNKLAYTEDFNVVVIQECTAVLYTEDGTAYADWSNVLESGSDRYDWGDAPEGTIHGSGSGEAQKEGGAGNE